MIPIVSIVGKSDSGKTTLIEKLVPELAGRGYKIATVKHDVHGFDVDHKGKDSWRHKQSGAHTVIISSPKKLALIRDVDKDHNLEQVRDKFIQDVDIIISEGYKSDIQPKIEIFRKEKHTDLLCTKEDNLVAIISNQAFDIGVPCIDLEDIKSLADFIETRFLKSRQERLVTLKVDGQNISLTPFITGLIYNTIKGMINSLRGTQSATRIDIRLEKGNDPVR